MKAAPFDYYRPGDLQKAVCLLRDAEGDAQVLGGGQSLLPMMAFRMACPSALVDLSDIAGLRSIEETDAGLRIGALVTHAALEDSALRRTVGRFLAQVAGGIAFRAIRNRGTIGGSLANADPAADWVTALACLNARVDVFGPEGPRQLDIEDLILGAMTTALEPGEIITAIHVPFRPDHTFGWHKFARKSGEFAMTLAAVSAGPEGLTGWLGAISDTPVSLPLTLPKAAGTRLTTRPEFPDLCAAIAERAPDAEPYQVHLGAVCLLEAAFKAQAGADHA